VVAPKNTLPWFRNPRVIAALGSLAIILIGVLVWQIQTNAEESEKLEKRQETLDDYTDQMRGIVQVLRSPAQAMATAPPAIEDPETADKLADDAAGWVKEFEGAQVDIGKIVPAQQGSIATAHSLYNQSIQIYLSAAKTLQLAAESEGDTQQQALALAAGQRAQATAVWTEATALLDKDRSSAELEPSGVTPPETPAGGSPTSPTGLSPTSPAGEIPPIEAPEGEAPTGEEEGGGQDGGDQGGGDQDGNGGGGGNGEGNEQ
jgi:hypothetical protein